MAYSLLRTGHAGEAIDALKIAVTRPGVSEMWAGRLRSLQALMLAMTRRLDEAAEVADRALADAERTADPFATGYLLHALSQVSFVGRDLAAALNAIDRALAVIGNGDQTTDLRLMLLANRVGALGLLDRHDEAIGAAGQALIVAERAGTSRLAVLRCTLAYQHFEVGQWDDALAELEPALSVDLGAGSSLAHGLIALIAGDRDQGDVAVAHLAALSEQGSRAAATASNSHYLHLAQAVAEERAGRQAVRSRCSPRAWPQAPPCACRPGTSSCRRWSGSRSRSATRTPPPRPRGRRRKRPSASPCRSRGPWPTTAVGC